jgi:hypothetical protein
MVKQYRFRAVNVLSVFVLPQALAAREPGNVLVREIGPHTGVPYVKVVFFANPSGNGLGRELYSTVALDGRSMFNRFVLSINLNYDPNQ